MSLTRSALLALANNRPVRERAMRAAFVRRSVSRFMPGERLEDALRAAADLSRDRIGTMLTRLGENVTMADAAGSVTAHYLDVLEAVTAAKVPAQISVKPTQLGLDLDAALCARHLDRLLQAVDATDNFLWIDMESSPYVDRTIELFARGRAKSPRIGLALQAYLRRTAADVRALLPLQPTIRLVKGAYLEPATVAFPGKAEVDASYYALACEVLEAGEQGRAQLQVATHDAALVERLSQFIASRPALRGRYEYAMLYGIQRGMQKRLAESGEPVRVLISYGSEWFPWYVRRLAERPANVWFVMKNIMAG